MMHDRVQAQEPTYRWPPRYWWLKRIALGPVAGLVALAVLGAAYVYDANRRLDAAVAAMQADGMRVLPEDFAPPSVPDSENAAVTLRGLAQAMKLGTGAEVVRTARSQPYLSWDRRKTNLQDAGAQRTWGLVQLRSAREEFISGNRTHAVTLVEDALFLATSIDRMERGFTALLASSSLRSEAVETCHQFVQFTYTRPPEQRSFVFTQIKLGQLIAALLRDEAALGATISAWEAEAASIYDDAKHGAGRSLDGIALPRWTIIAAPVFQRDGARMLTAYGDAIRSLKAMPARDGSSAADSYRRATMLSEIVHTFADARTSNYVRNMDDYRMAVANTRAAAIQLAIVAYRLDHDEALPESLDALIPTYLEHVPLDPFASGNQPFRYKPDQRLFYSVGRNGVDDGGIAGDQDPRTKQWMLRILQKDILCPLWPETVPVRGISSGARSSALTRSAEESRESETPATRAAD